MKKRLFLAIDIPGEIKKSLSRVKNESAQNVKWTKPRNLHLTLLFLGNIEEKIIPQIAERIRPILTSASVFDLKLEQLMLVPKLKPYMVGAIFKPTKELVNIRKKLTSLVIDYADKKYREGSDLHVTLARFKSSPPNLDLRHLQKDLRFKVSEIVLYESRLDNDGPIYFPLARFKLKV